MTKAFAIPGLAVALAAAMAPATCVADSAVFEGRTVLGTFSFGAPAGIGLGAELRLGDRFSVGLGLAGFASRLGREKAVRIGTGSGEIRGRWHAFGGSFFLGLALGARTFFAEADKAIDVSGTAVPTNLAILFNSGYASPHLGWLWVFGRGFTLGAELGAQIPTKPRGALETSISDPSLNGFLDQVKTTDSYKQLETSIDSYGKLYGGLVLPHLMFRLGWAF